MNKREVEEQVTGSAYDGQYFSLSVPGHLADGITPTELTYEQISEGNTATKTSVQRRLTADEIDNTDTASDTSMDDAREAGNNLSPHICTYV